MADELTDSRSGGRAYGHRPGLADVGRRVSLRRLVGDPAAPGDVVGRLLAWTDGELWVRRNDTRVVAVPAAELVAGIVVPEHPRAGHVREPVPPPEELQRVADAGWPAAQRCGLGAWVLRAHHGVTRRANSVLAPGPLPDDLDPLLAQAAAWYAERGLPLLVQTPGGGPADVELARRGWVRGEATLFQTADTRPTVDGLPSPRKGLAASRSPAPDDAWYAVDGDPDPLRRAILTGPEQVAFVTVRGPDGEPWGVGRASVVKGWAGITSVTTAANVRGQGVAGAVMRALLRWAAEEGAGQAYVQVRTANRAARALYDGMGFTTHHTYGYLGPPNT